MLKALITLGGLQFLTMLALLVRTKTLAVLLGPIGVGVLSTVDKLLATVAQTVSLSLPFAAVRFLPELWSQDRQEFVSLFRRMRNLLVVLASLTMTLALLATTLAPAFWGKELLFYQSVVFCAFWGLPVVMLVPFLQSAIAGRLTHNLSLLFTLGHAILLTLTGVLGVWWKGLAGLYILYAVAGLILVILVLRLTARIPDGVANKKQGGDLSVRLPARVWKFGVSLWGLAFVTPFAALYVNYQVLGAFGAETAGWMQAAMGVGLITRNLLGAAHPLYLTPHVNRGGTVQERMQWVGEFQKTFSFVCLLAVLPLLLFPRIVVETIYSAKFLPGAAFVALFVAAEVLTLLAGTYQVLIVAFNHVGFHVTQNLLAQGVVLLMAVFTIKPYGILGAGLAAVSAQVVLYTGSTLFLRSRYGLKVPLRSNLLMLYIVLALSSAGLVGALDAQSSWGVIFFKVLFYGILTAGLALFLTAKDRENLSRMTRQAWSRLQSARLAKKPI